MTLQLRRLLRNQPTTKQDSHFFHPPTQENLGEIDLYQMKSFKIFMETMTFNTIDFSDIYKFPIKDEHIALKLTNYHSIKHHN